MALQDHEKNGDPDASNTEPSRAPRALTWCAAGPRCVHDRPRWPRGSRARRQREIFDLVDLQGLSPAEAAERTGMKPVSVRANLFKARKAIRESLLATHPSYRELSR